MFGFALEATVTWLEVAACDVTHGHLVKALVDLATRLRLILELQFVARSRVKVVVAGNDDGVAFHLGFDLASNSGAARLSHLVVLLCLLETGLVVSRSHVLVDAELVVCLHASPGDPLGLL